MMASGRAHFAANVAVLGVTTAACWWVNAPYDAAFPLLAGMGAATFITPDFDMQQTTVTERKLLRVPVVGDVIVASWLPYGLRFAHRGISHHWLFGTMTRLGYAALLLVLGWVFLVGVVVLWRGDVPAWAWSVTPVTALWFVAGWWVQDIVHLILDR